MKFLQSFIALSLCAVMFLAFAGCGGEKEVVLSSVLDSVNTEFSVDKDSMIMVEDTDTLELYYDISPADVKQFAAETTKNSATDITEFIFVEAVSADAAKRVYDALEFRYNSQKDLCASYSPELLSVVQKCSVVQEGNFVILVMSDNFDAVTEYYKTLF